ncbi:HEPN domain-containing protein [Paenibacillus sp. IB182496]|uniref:HEPN domain-containing protein n=1 Tax=Paenibacillus sabuli TaxID=2772509 RepID=A0A927BYM2_9BACL|nr:HEPN domain-containing protein [Paenibacillus sabuli]MBD2848150.1 HEPN domain-containing protein [Paenibacillus sabuli]
MKNNDCLEWFNKSKGDWRSAEVLKASGEFDTSCYHYHQSAFTHDLELGIVFAWS